nr:hypothetical protein CFP56_52155 [Quercus suber]
MPAAMYRLPGALTRQQIAILRHHSRLARNISSTRQHFAKESTNIRPIRLKQAGWNYRRTATYALYAGAGYAYLNVLSRYVGIEFLDEEEVEEEEKKSAQEEEEEAQDGPPFYVEEDSLFIPMTWSKKLPRSWYRGSDPEWQEFVKVAKDKPRQKRINDELVQMVLTGAKKHPLMTRQLGSDPKIGKFWLDSSFPDGPPQEYERSGIEIGDDFIAWSQQKLDQEEQWRLQRALWPRAALDSLWAMSKVSFGMNYRRLRRALGWEDEPDPKHPEEQFKQAIELMQKHQQWSQGKGPADSQASSRDMSSTQAPARNPAHTPDQEKKIPLPFGLSVPNVLGTSADSDNPPVALHVFRATLSKSWNPKRGEPPRGTFVVQGLVEIRGSQGRFMLDVQSCYDPAQSKFVAVNAAVRSYKKWKQTPKGGP